MRIVCQQTILMKYHALFVEKAPKFEIVICCKLKVPLYGLRWMVNVLKFWTIFSFCFQTNVGYLVWNSQNAYLKSKQGRLWSDCFWVCTVFLDFFWRTMFKILKHLLQIFVLKLNWCMRRLIWGFAGRTYHIVGNLKLRLICLKKFTKNTCDSDVLVLCLWEMYKIWNLCQPLKQKWASNC